MPSNSYSQANAYMHYVSVAYEAGKPEFLQNEADGPILSSRPVFVLVTKSKQQNPKQSYFFLIKFSAPKRECLTPV